jgi:hypothetical protein
VLLPASHGGRRRHPTEGSIGWRPQAESRLIGLSAGGSPDASQKNERRQNRAPPASVFTGTIDP